MRIKIPSNFIDSNYQETELINEILSFLESHLKENSCPEAVMDKILDKSFIHSNPNYYIYYPYLFNSYFNIQDKKALNTISAAGFLYYKSILFIDNIFDSGISKGKFKTFLISSYCQEECIKLLCSVFELKSKFWSLWSLRKGQYAEAYTLERNNGEKGYGEFEIIADYKSAFGKIAIDALYDISGKKDGQMYKNLLESHKNFYIGFQIMDDIRDYKEDLKNGQFNISDFELNKLFEKENKDIDKFTIEEKNKLLYLKQVARDLYLKVREYANNALKVSPIAKTLPTLWTSEIIKLHNTAINHFLNIDGYLKKVKTKGSEVHTLKDENTITQAVQTALKWILTKQEGNGSWEDFLNDAGLGDVWVTSYLLYSISGIANIEKEEFYQRGVKFVKENGIDGGWGYNSKWIADVDSSSFAMLSLKRELIETDDLVTWQDYQNNDFGFSTYKDKNELLASLNISKNINVDGWTQSQFCVTAVCYLVFVKYELDNVAFKNVRKYIIEKLKTEQVGYTYWWTESIYSLYYILRGAVISLDHEVINLCETRISELAHKEYSSFYKGILISTLCLTDKLFKTHSDVLSGLVEELVKSQYIDGSWKPCFALRIPHPSIVNPDKKEINWIKGDRGTNILVEDHNRIFTTSSCLNALYSYGQRH